VNATDNEQHTAMHWAVYEGHSRMVELLMLNWPDLLAIDNRGMMPIHWAAAKVRPAEQRSGRRAAAHLCRVTCT
jgi:ankyrin repeat protein